MALASLKELYLDELGDLYDAEAQVVRTLPRLLERATRDAKIDIVTPLTVAATDATLTSVQVTGGATSVAGSFTAARTSWTSEADTVLASGTT